jgi:hypothetical protein
MPSSVSARAFIALVIALGLAVLGDAIFSAPTIYIVRLASFLLVACIAARLKVKLPGITGSMAVNLPFVLVAAAEMSLVESLIVGCVSNFVQCLPRAGKKFNLVQMAFNVSNMALAVAATRLVYGSSWITASVASPPLRLGIATAGFLLVNTIPVAFVIFLTEGKSVLRTWLGIFQLSFPYFLASAGVAGVVLTLASRVGWPVPILILPLMAGVFYSYRRFCSTPPTAWAGVPLEKMGPEGVRAALEGGKESLA